MRTIEEKLQEHKQSYNRVQAPLELESRLRNALQNVPAKPRYRKKALPWVASAAAALILIAGLYQYPAFAYYGAKLLDRSELSSLSFSEVAEQGYGQTVNKSKTFDDGTVITVNGVIADDNAFLLYYTIDFPAGSRYDADDRLSHYINKLQGFLTDSDPKEGNGNYSNDGLQYKGVYKFEPVSPFSRTLTATFIIWQDNGERASYPISFQFEANKAMKSIVKQNISQFVAVDQGTVHYDSITASPSSTIVRGHYELEKERHPRFSGKTKLLVNGTEVKKWGMRGSNIYAEKGFPGFELEFEVLPTDKIETIELVLENFGAYQQVEEPISLVSPSDQSIRIGREKLWIRSVTKTDSGYDIVIARKQFIILDTDSLSVQAGGNLVPVASISASRPWDLNNGNVLWEQTYSFNTADKPEQLLLDGFHYIKTYDKKITIPVDSKK
ncbi:DUF4179 domain-containing protein [Paenibacillus ihbetae]|uniref:DUF4179 domain-containing protein n=1 Tax=Paenibacillus ihbetae TaxID=1870820 RepID=A0A1B2DU77_9BACL|nr:DUF4179 domain-containing protein [Paenibacillus ihbetae]ANY71261.1 hypothetical protein BBD41_00915 [Paenibacillus ihbetae]OOC61376.1 hypothetical protein BBD40_05435 [Paenibacillus ihbetae]